MRINRLQQNPISYKGLNLFGKIKALVSKPQKDTFVKTVQNNNQEQNNKSSTPSVDAKDSKFDVVQQSSNDSVSSEISETKEVNQTVSGSTLEEEFSSENVQQNIKEDSISIEQQQIYEREKAFEEYFSEFFQKVHLSRSTDSYCKLLEQKLREKGVIVTFDNDALTAKKLYKAIVEVQDRGIKVPHEIMLMTPHDEELLGFTPTTVEGYEEFAPIFIKKGIKDDNERLSPKLKELGYRHYTDDTARGTIIHEIGHYNHLPLMLSEIESIQIWKKHFPNFEDEFEFGKKVSAHAITDKTGAEFVAEVFTALVNGETFDDEVMSLYKELNGPEVP